MIHVRRRVAGLSRLILLLTGLAVAVTAIWLARRGPAFATSGTEPYATVAELAAGWALILTGIVASRRRPGSPFGWILAVAGLAWFLVEWPNPASAGSLIFSVGLIFHIAYPALIAHAALAFPEMRPTAAGPSRSDRLCISDEHRPARPVADALLRARRRAMCWLSGKRFRYWIESRVIASAIRLGLVLEVGLDRRRDRSHGRRLVRATRFHAG